jgi:uncharacterized protein GlcG (DUF336 family)
MVMRFLVSIFLLTSIAATAELPAAPPPFPGAAPLPSAPGPALENAIAAGQAALAACRARGFAVSVSVVDTAGVLKALLAADGASARGVQSSTNKAITALIFKASTSDLNARIDTDKELAAAVGANQNFNTHPGGLLIRDASGIVGAIGVGGARPSEIDEACAATGLERLTAGKRPSDTR